MADFDDLLAANADYAASFALEGIPGAAARGVAVVTCMDARIDPLAILGLQVGDAKVMRTPGGRVDDTALEGVVLATNLLGCERVMVIEHTRCAVASNSVEQLSAKVAEATGQDASGQAFHAIADQSAQLAADVEAIRSHPLVPDTAVVGGFVYDVDTGRVERVV